MATSPRIPGRRGRKPARPPGHRLALRYVHEYAPLPPPAYPVDVTSGITAWQMLGNGPDPTCTTHPDGVSDCSFAARQHARMAKAAAGHETPAWETADELVAEYLAYDHGQDDGVVLADVLLAWHQAGKITAFAPVDHTSAPRMDAAMQAFHGVIAGVDLTADADGLFSDGMPWTTAQGQQPGPDNGHCILKVKAGGGLANSTWVTWGAEQDSTPAWAAACLREAWVIITAEDAEAASLDLPALHADIAALHGTE